MNCPACFKRTVLLSASAILLASCGSETATEEVEAPVEQSEEETTESTETTEEQANSASEQTEEPNGSSESQSEEEGDSEETSSEASDSQDSSDLSENQETSKESEDQSADQSEEQSDEQSETEISEKEAVESVMEYAEEEGFDLEGLKFMTTDSDEVYKVQMFRFVPEDAEEQKMQTQKWYEVEKETGEIRSMMDQFSKDYISDVVSMSEAERESYHRSLAATEEDLSEKVFDQLLLPGVHENTAYYEGRVGSEEHVRLEYPASVSITNRISLDPTIDEEGYFYIDMSQFNLEAGESFVLRITGGYPLEQVFELPVYEEQKGMEEIHVRE